MCNIMQCRTSVRLCNQCNIVFNYFHLFLFCMSVKPATPTIAKLSYVNNGIHLQWSESGSIPANCLSYEVRYHKGDLTTAQTIQVSFHCLHLTVVFCFVFPVHRITEWLRLNAMCCVCMGWLH